MDAAEININISRSDLVLSFFSPLADPKTSFRARASGVFLVAGVGSYCAYRICTKYLGRRFVWMLLDSARYDNIATADRRLLYASGVPDEETTSNRDPAEDEGDCDSEWLDRVNGSRPASEVSILRLSRVRRSTRGKGLLGIRQSRASREGVVSRQGSNISDRSRSRGVSPAFSDCSASLRIVWEGQQDWDDEFADQPGTSNAVRPYSGSLLSRPGRLPEIPADDMLHGAPSMGDLCSVFDDVMSMTSAAPNEYFNDEVIDEEEDEEQMITSTSKCKINNKLLYQSFIAGSEMGSESGSVYGGSVASIRSSLRKKIVKTMDPQGLWDLAQEGPSTSKGNLNTDNEMTDSGMSRSTQSKKSSSQGYRSMFDSAIGADLLSEDESAEKEKSPLRPLPEFDTISIAQSEVSMEWFDEGIKEREVSSEDDAPMATMEGVEWEFDIQQSSFGSFAGSSRAIEPGPVTVSSHFRPPEGRDLMVLACELYQPYSPQFKILHQLYHRRRLKRIATISEATSDSQLLLFLTSAMYHKYNVIRDSTWEALEKRLDRCLDECDFLGKARQPALARKQLRALWDLTVSLCDDINMEHVAGLQLLMTLEAKKCYDERLRGSRQHEWFTVDSPATVLKKLDEKTVLDEICWRLLTGCTDISIHVQDISSSSSSFTLGDSPNVLHWLKIGSLPAPLFYVPDS